MKKTKFNTENKIVADFEFLYDLYIKGRKFYEVDTIVSCVSDQGVSDTNRYNAIWAYWRVINSYQHNAFRSVYYMYKMLDALIRSVVKRLLPMVLIRRFRRFRARKGYSKENHH